MMPLQGLRQQGMKSVSMQRSANGIKGVYRHRPNANQAACYQLKS